MKFILINIPNNHYSFIFIGNMPLKQIKKKVSIDLNIRALQINNLTQNIDVLILWKQRTKAIDTKVQRLGPERPMAIFDEKF